MKTSGSSARMTSTSPPPPSTTGASCVRAVSPHAASAVETKAERIIRGVHHGCDWSSSAAAPVTCGADMLVPSKTANGEPLPADSGGVEERICPPGAATSGLSACPKFVGAADEKLVTTPLRPVTTSAGARSARTIVRPPRCAMYARSRSPSTSAIIPAGTASWSGIAFASPKRLSTRISPTAPAARARAAFEANVQTPREASATSPASDPAGSGFELASFGSAPSPQSRASTGRPFAPMIVVTSTSVRCALTAGTSNAAASGIVWSDAGASGARMCSGGA